MDAAAIATLIQELSGDPKEDEAVERILRRVSEDFPECDECSVLVRRGRAIEMAAATGPTATVADEAQLEMDEGPCLTGLREQEITIVDDISRERRWPRWAHVAQEAGFHSSLSVRLATREGTFGSLNLYSSRVAAFDEEAVGLAVVYARLAAVILLNAREADGLRDALQRRHVIATAQGILMRQYGLSLAQSFEVLRRWSNETNTKIRDVALQTVRETDPTAWPGGSVDAGAGRKPVPRG